MNRRSIPRAVLSAVTNSASLPSSIFCFVVFVCLILLTAEGVHLWQDRSRVIADSTRDTSNLARSVAQHAEDTFRTIDLSLADVAERVEHDGQNAAALGRLRSFLSTRAMALQSRELAAFDRQGHLIVASSDHPPIIDVAGNADFRRQSETSDADIHIGAPERNGDGNSWIIPVTRRLDDVDGGFAGVVFAAIDVNYFQNYYQTFDIGAHGAILLAKSNGTLLVRRPFEESQVGASLLEGGIFKALQEQGPVGNADIYAVTDGVERLNSYRKLAAYPLVVAVALQKDEMLAPWRAAIWANSISDASVAAVMVLFGLLLMHQARARARSERTADEAMRRYRLIAENTSDLIMQIGPDGSRVYVSPRSREMFGYEPEELIGEPVGSLLHPDDRGNWRAPVDISDGSGPPTLQATYRALHKDGHSVWIEANRQPLPEGGYIVSQRNISIRKRIQADLDMTRRRLAQAQRVAKIGYWVGDEPTQSSVWSPELFDIFGLPAQERVARAVAFEPLHPQDRARFLSDRQKSIETRMSFSGEYRVQRPNGEIRWVFIDGQPEYDSAGRHAGFFGIVQDITAQYLSRIELVQAKEEAERAGQSKAMFLANMSHELRTPLNAVIGFSDMIEQQAFGPVGHRNYQEYAADIRASGEHLLSLINDILDQVKAEQGYLELDEGEVDISNLISFAVHMLAPRAARAEVKLETTIRSDLCSIRGDERRLRQVILNLLTNAIKFTRRGGRVTIVAELGADGEFVMTVEDTGIGISPEDQLKIFEPFVQAADGRRVEGTGLGLALAKRLVELHGGTMELHSELGIGTIVFVRLPADRMIARSDTGAVG